jgi:hypothetical protein
MASAPPLESLLSERAPSYVDACPPDDVCTGIRTRRGGTGPLSELPSLKC